MPLDPRTMPEERYKPGQKIPKSGVYMVHHADHRADHEATMLAGDLFPECSVCTDSVRFRLIKSASVIESDEDFRKRRRAHGA
ncbi:MAG: YjzC family protein [Acidobacteria bacterium]|nr:YjzC family protein [Acidobacteriaceae bacterium]MBV9608819.1 YjzC family protein [Acidobacteriota bacterium]